MSARFVVIGDLLLDRDIDGDVDRVAPDAPVPVVDQVSERTRPGGAGLAAVLAARDGLDTTLITAVGRDGGGAIAAELLAEEGVRVIDLGTSAPTPEKTRIRCDGRPLVRLDRGGDRRGDIGPPPGDAFDAIADAACILVSDYGRGMTGVSHLLETVETAARHTPVVWDPHTRGAIPRPGITVVTPNMSEANRFVPEVSGNGLGTVRLRARKLIDKWSVVGVAVTMGAQGALFVDGGAHPLMVPAPQTQSSDTCGAGDRFAVSVASGLGAGMLPSAATTQAVMTSSQFVAQGGAGAIRIPAESRPGDTGDESEAARLAAIVRQRGGKVVATGGCFDLIHPGHVALLESARSLGDCLIVCLNSDQSVRQLKGPDRPINSCPDRSAVLLGLSSVDAVEVFHSTTPHDALRNIKPHIWVKGGDYGSTPLPESELVESWGGDVIILPYMRGHSTTGLLARAREQ